MSNMIPHNTVFGYKPYLPSAIRADRLWVSVASYSGREGASSWAEKIWVGLAQSADFLVRMSKMFRIFPYTYTNELRITL